MWQDDNKRQTRDPFYDMTFGDKTGGGGNCHDIDQKGQGFFSDLLGGITKEAVKDVAKSAAKEGAKAVSAGVFEGTKKTIDEGARRVGKKAVDKVFGDQKKQQVSIPEERTKQVIDEVKEGEEKEEPENWEIMKPLMEKIMKKNQKKKKKRPKYEEELEKFFGEF